MPESAGRTPTDAGLRERIDEIATQLLLAGPADGLAADLALLSELAASQGCRDTARIASELAASAVSRPGAALEEELRQGMARLQEALAAEKSAAFVWEPDPPATPPNSLAQDPELVGDFIVEAREHLTSIETCILALDKNPADREAIHSIFRGFHTIKGLAGFLELWEVQKVAHEVETILDQARNLKFKVSPEAIDVILQSSDYIKRWLGHLESVLQGKDSRAPESDPKLLARVAAIPVLQPYRPKDPGKTRAAVGPWQSKWIRPNWIIWSTWPARW